MFLVFPLNSKPDWRRPPILTILVILINCIVFFGPQSRDEDRADKAAQYYVRSELPKIELPLYLEHVRLRTEKLEKARARHLEMLIARQRWGEALEIMDNDARFMPALLAGNVVPTEHPRRAAWTEQRTRYAALRGDRFTESWLFVPADASPATAVTSTFMHGSTGHLVGNMVFLFAFGYTVEMALGGPLFLAFYLLSGIAGNLMDLIVRAGSPIGGLGASGAVSGLMAMYAVLYGRQKIRFFYQLLFYFDYVRAPAIILLPAWIANELIQYVMSPGSNVNYMAHAGGLACGGLLIWLWRRQRPHGQVELPQGPKEDPWDVEFRQARELLDRLKMDDAKALYAKLSDARPDRLDALTRYFGLARAAPSEEHFHRAAARAFSLPSQDEQSHAFVREAFAAYLKEALPRPRLTPDQIGRVGLRLARAGYVDDAIRTESMLARLAPGHDALPALRLALTSNLLRASRRDDAVACAERLAQAAPGSSEARLAAELVAG
jgi:membrane associated rhomboid family serine protease